MRTRCCASLRAESVRVAGGGDEEGAVLEVSDDPLELPIRLEGDVLCVFVADAADPARAFAREERSVAEATGLRKGVSSHKVMCILAPRSGTRL